jgi:hypothetical protein
MSDLSEEELELLRQAEAEDAELGVVLAVGTEVPRRRGRPKKIVEVPAVVAGPAVAVEDLRDPTEGQAVDVSPEPTEPMVDPGPPARFGPITPVQFEGDGWNGLPVQMRG